MFCTYAGSVKDIFSFRRAAELTADGKAQLEDAAKTEPSVWDKVKRTVTGAPVPPAEKAKGAYDDAIKQGKQVSTHTIALTPRAR